MEHGALLKARVRRVLRLRLISCVFLAIACSDDGCPMGQLGLPKLLSIELLTVTIGGVGSQPITCTWNRDWECVPRAGSRIRYSATYDQFFFAQLGQKASYPARIEGPLGTVDSTLTVGIVIREPHSNECTYQSLALPREDFEKVGAVLVPVK